jgi:FkbM family methyltransferase
VNIHAEAGAEEFRIENGFLWPKNDKHCAAAAFSQLKDLQRAVNYARKLDVVVQAGGNCGVWAAELAGRFEAVYTFEPDPDNFACLAHNTRHLPNVVKMQAALGDARGPVGLLRDPSNAGATRVTGRGLIPTLRIDDLGLRKCDLIYLDIEGKELSALSGARKTIGECKPVVVVEDKGVSSHYGVPQGEVVNWMRQNFDYVAVKNLGRDVVLVPSDHPAVPPKA